ncbi:MAG: hypothetical protein ACREAC_31790, partial [Blastocatellia bacterium]
MKERSVTFKPKQLAFQRREAMRFEWLALLAYARKAESNSGGWVSIEEIRRLPLWRGKSLQHTGTNVGRYLQQLERKRVKLVEARSKWRGPYRLAIPPDSISFDVALDDARAQVGVANAKPPNRKQLLQFTEKYSRATSLFMEGYLSFDMHVRAKHQESALAGFSSLARQAGLDARLRVLAQLGAIRVLDRLGRYETVADRLDECKKLVRQV